MFVIDSCESFFVLSIKDRLDDTKKEKAIMIRYYVRVSTMEQKIDRQLVAYPKADFQYIDKMSGRSKERLELQRLLADLQTGDVVVVKSLDRLSRSTKDMLELVDAIKDKKASLQILDMNLDTSTPQGEFFLTILAAIAQLERQTIRERTLEGVAIAKATGKYKGRKKGSIELRGKPLEEFVYLYNLGMNKSRLAQRFSVPRSTIYRWIDTLIARKKIKKKETSIKNRLNPILYSCPS